MISNNGLMTYKSKRLSFINKGIITILLGLSLIVIVPCSYLFFTYWSEMPIFIKIFWPLLLAIIFLGLIVTPLNGMNVTKRGTILFWPDFRLKIIKVSEIEKLSIVFTEQKNNRYSVMIKFLYKDGRVFYKDYSKQFINMKNKKLAMSIYTITEKKIKKCNKLLDLNICVISILNKNGEIIYQSK